MSGAVTGQTAAACPQCGTHVAPALLACPSCERLVHADELKRLAAAAERAANVGDVSTALAAWRDTLDLLPRDSTQHQVISARVLDLSRALDGQPRAAAAPAAPTHRSRLGRGAAGLGALGVLLAKFKFAIVFLLTKAKLLLLGLTKAGTLVTMLLSMGVYWTIWGWQFAVGVVLSIYVHEMGHVQALQRYGIKATAPMFIPGVGAFVRLKQYPADRREDARVGLAGPVWGLAAALVAYAVYRATGSGLWGAVARFGAWVNLFNLTPVWQLDGGRGFRALTRLQRWTAVAVIAATWFLTGEGLLALLGVAAVAHAGFTAPAEEPDGTALVQYCLLVVVLGAMAQIAIPAMPR